MVNRIF